MLHFTKTMNLVDSEINLSFSVFKCLFSKEETASNLIDSENFINMDSQAKCNFVLALSKLFSYINLNQYDHLTRKDELVFIYALCKNVQNVLAVKLSENQQL